MKETLGNFFSVLKCFFLENYIVLFFMFSLYVELLILIKEINGSFEVFPAIIYPFVFCAISSFLIYSPFFFIRKRKIVYISVFSFIMTSIFVVDLTYFHYFRSIPSVALFDILGQANDVTPAVLKVFSPLDLLYFINIPIAIVIYKVVNKKTKKSKLKGNSKSLFRFNAGLVIVGVLLTFLAFFADRNHFLPKAFNNVMDNKILMERYGLLLTHVFDVYRNTDQRFHTISKEEKEKTRKWIQENDYPSTVNDKTGVAQGKNIIFIQVESLQGFILDKKVEGQEITPNINKLAKQSYSFDNHFFQLGAGSTSDTDFTVNTSYYPLKDTANFVRYGKDDFTSLPKELKGEGYSAYAYHAYDRNFWNRNTAFRYMGYDKYMARDNYPEGDFINMGLDDKTFLSKTVEYLKEQPKPSFSYIMTLSSHFPFQTEDRLKGLKLDKEKYPEISYNYLENINYTDSALGEFLDKLKGEGLYDDSLIVLYGDHSAKIESFGLDGYSFDSQNVQDRKVPLLMKIPGQSEGFKSHDVSSHIDIMPTVLNLTGTKKDVFTFGRDLFSGSNPFFSSVAYFDDQTIADREKIYRLKGDSSNSCDAFREGVITVSRGLDCSDLVKRKEQEQKISETIVRNNLFQYVNE